MENIQLFSEKNENDNKEEIVISGDHSPKNHDDGSDRKKNFFWQKWAFVSEDEKSDKIIKNEVTQNTEIREVIKNFESRVLGKKILFNDVHPKNSSVKKWILTILNNYPKNSEQEVEYVIDDFRSRLYTSSKTKYKNIVGVLLLNDLLLIIHCKKSPTLVESETRIITANQILSSDNVIRAAIIKNDDGKLSFSAYERSRKWSKGHAEFWGIDPEYITWDSIGYIYLTIEIDGFNYPIQLPLESEEFDEMVNNRSITPTGDIQIGRFTGKITKGRVFRLEMPFNEFFEFYVVQHERLDAHKKKFKELIKPEYAPIISEQYDKIKKTFRYEEDFTKVFEITTEGKIPIHLKDHHRFTICFFTNSIPRIRASQNMVNAFYESIFQNKPLDIWHAGEDSNNEPICVGSLNIFNKVPLKQQCFEFSEKLLQIIQDTQSKKTRKLLEKTFCLFWKNNLECQHLNVLFDLIIDSIVNPELEFHFKRPGILDKENFLEFKSSSDIDPKPSRFVKNTLIPTILKYLNDEGLKRYCILYGIEDSGEIIPAHRLKSDQITDIEKKANETLKSHNIQVNAYPIPFENGIILSVILIPLI